MAAVAAPLSVGGAVRREAVEPVRRRQRLWAGAAAEAGVPAVSPPVSAA